MNNNMTTEWILINLQRAERSLRDLDFKDALYNLKFVIDKLEQEVKADVEAEEENDNEVCACIVSPELNRIRKMHIDKVHFCVSYGKNINKIT